MFFAYPPGRPGVGQGLVMATDFQALSLKHACRCVDTLRIYFQGAMLGEQQCDVPKTAHTPDIGPLGRASHDFDRMCPVAQLQRVATDSNKHFTRRAI